MLTVVIPTYYERENIRPLVFRIADALKFLNGDYEIVFVDDDSGDGTCRCWASSCGGNLARW